MMMNWILKPNGKENDILLDPMMCIGIGVTCKATNGAFIEFEMDEEMGTDAWDKLDDET